MGFFETDVRNGFDTMFDLNRDGQLDPAERGMQFRYMERVSEGKDPWSDDTDDDSEEDEYDELQDEIDGMDEDEAREYLESEGFDADDFDF